MKKTRLLIFFCSSISICTSKFNIYSWFWVSTSVKLLEESWTQFWQPNLRLHLNYSLYRPLTRCWAVHGGYYPQIPESHAWSTLLKFLSFLDNLRQIPWELPPPTCILNLTQTLILIHLFHVFISLLRSKCNPLLEISPIKHTFSRIHPK